MTNNEHTFNTNNKNLTHVNLHMELGFVNFSKKNSKAYKLKFTCAIGNTIYTNRVEYKFTCMGFSLSF